MKLRHLTFFAIIAALLAACNFTLAQDVTPPPDYVPPTPVPTLGPLYPASAPDVKNGEAIYVEKCAACHGDTGLGDGAQGQQLSVPVAALGLPAIAQKALPSDWYTEVTQGNIKRFMPPFTSLSDQERWDVVAYALTLHTKPNQIEKGKSLFEANCADCAKNFSNQKMMSALSENDLINLIKNGAGNIPAFGSKFTDDEAAAVAAYIRRLTFTAPPVASTIAPATQISANADSGTPSAGTTPPADGGTAQAQVTPEATVVAKTGKVSGSIDNQTGTDLPSNLKVTLHIFAHSGDMNAGPKEITTLESTANTDGTFVFENVEIPESRIFIAEVDMNGMTYQSDLTVVKAGDTELTLPPIKLFAASSDLSKLTVNQTHIFLDVKDGTLQVIEFFNVVNSTDTSISVSVVDNQMAIAKMPANMTSLGFDAQQGQAMPVQTASGFALPPSDKMYGIAVGFEMPYAKSAEIEIPFVLGIPSGSVLTPIGVKVEGTGFVDKGPTDIGTGTKYQVYEFGEIKPDGVLKIKLSGQPEQTPAAAANSTGTKSNQPLLIGVGAFGVALILAGAWMFMRDRRKREEEAVEEETDEFEDPESLMDAIIALDDLHRAGKLSDEAYQQRRNELKDALKRKK
jgi:mono/diheme cytochrome c family protein